MIFIISAVVGPGGAGNGAEITVVAVERALAG